MKLYDLLFEEIAADTPESSMKMTNSKLKARKALDSVDDQIDSLILRYEASSIKDDDVGSLAELSIKNKNLKFLFEAEDDELADEGLGDEEAEAEVEDEDPGPPTGSEEMTVDEPAEKQEIPNLDVDAFASRAVRLITNYKSLLKIEEAVGNRFKNFLDENYGDEYVQRFIEILSSQYGISLEEFEDERGTKDEPFAVGAYAGGTGGLGGGGG